MDATKRDATRRRAENKNKERQNVDERKLLRREMGNIFSRVLLFRSGYIIQAIRDGNADIVTSIPLEKETPAVLRE